MTEYNVSLRKPNKRYAVKKEDRVILKKEDPVVRLQDYLKKHLDG